MGRVPVRRIAYNEYASTDDTYYVSAADVADKIIDRMRSGSDPLLIRSSMFALVPASATWSTPVQNKPD